MPLPEGDPVMVPASTLRPRQRINHNGAIYRVTSSAPSGRRNGWALHLSGAGGHSNIIMPADAPVELAPGKAPRVRRRR